MNTPIDDPIDFLQEKIEALRRQLHLQTNRQHELARDAMFWEGKFKIVKNENNKLRRRLYKNQCAFIADSWEEKREQRLFGDDKLLEKLENKHG